MTGKGHKGVVSGLCVTQDGRVLSTSTDDTARVYALNDEMKELHVFKLDKDGDLFPGLFGAMITPDQKSAVIIDGAHLRLMDLDKGTGRAVSDKLPDHIAGLDVSPDGSLAVTGCLDKIVRVWDLKTGKEVARFTGHTGGLHAVRFLEGGKQVVSAGVDKRLYVWDSRTGKEVYHLDGHDKGINSLAVTPDGKTLVSGGVDQTLRVWDLATRRERYRLDGFQNTVSAVAVSPDGRFGMAASLQGRVRAWDMESGRELAINGGDQLNCEQMTFSPDGKFLLGGGPGLGEVGVCEVTVEAPKP
jgi:WD40 repeat protein